MLFVVASVGFLCPSIAAAETISPKSDSISQKTVLVLHTYGSQSAFRPLFDRALQQTLNHNGFEDAEVYMETLESNRFSGSKHAAVFQYYLGQKYAGLKIDLVITVWNPALNYALEHRQELFPDAPILAVVTRPRTFASDANIAQVTAGDHFLDTADLALKLHPNTRRIAVVNGSFQSNDDVQTEIARQLGQLSPQVGVEYWRNLTVVNLIERVKALPDNSVILYVRQTAKASTQPITQSESLEQVLEAAKVPVYVGAESLVGRGVVGGVVFKNDTMAELAANTAIRIMRGTPASELSVRKGQALPMFDWRQLRRWNIQLDQLPPNSDVRFREYTFWEQNRRYIAGASAVFLIQSCLIAGLLMQRSRRRRAEGALRTNEQALQVSQEDSRKLAGRIIAAQEVERGRIARELHDDISQKVALLAMDIHQIGLSDAPGVRARANVMSERTAEIATDLHNLSHELHPAKLQILGLVQATQYLCRDLAARHQVGIDYAHERMPSTVPPETALCLYRIVQEALQNVVRHSGARNATVRLTGSAESLELEVLDSGKGFEITRLGDGMGLLSMRERVNFLHGQMTMWSKPGVGTRLVVNVPVARADATAGRATAQIA
jgi:signal transduction histidine kinase